MIGFGALSGGLGIILSKFIKRSIAFNITAITLYVMPAILFIEAMGNWITDINGIPIEILIIGMIEIIIGSVMFVAINLPILMRALRHMLIRIKGVKGVGQISPALISSHVTRSTLTFAIFAIILTLNVIVATLIPTSLGTLSQTEDESRGIDLSVFLNKPEAIINGTSFSQQLYKIDNRITDVIGFKTFHPKDYTKFSALREPFSADFDASTDILPINLAEFKSEQIRGNATDCFRSKLAIRFLPKRLPRRRPPIPNLRPNRPRTPRFIQKSMGQILRSKLQNGSIQRHIRTSRSNHRRIRPI